MVESCPQGEFYNPADGDCVTECPCGTYGDGFFSYSSQCRKGMQTHLNVFYHECHCVLIFTADSDSLFFNQTYISSSVSLSNTTETPIATVKLVADQNLAKNGSVRFYHHLYSIVNYHYIHSYQSIANTRIDVNGQSAQPLISFNSTNSTECSNGTHTFHFVVVNIYINITGEIYFYLNAEMNNQGYHVGSVYVRARISDGMHSYFNCNLIS